MKCPECKAEIKKKYREIKMEIILVVDEKWDDEDTGHTMQDLLGNQQCEGIHGVADARVLGVRDCEEYDDDYPFYDDGAIWNGWDNCRTE